MIVNVQLYTKIYEAEMKVDGGRVIITLLPHSQEQLEEYLRLVLPHYTTLPEKELSFGELLEIAANWQQENPDIALSEPTTKLPYDVPIEVKKMLEDLADLNRKTQTQMLIDLIDSEYERVVKGE
jgi:hypothetical protein